MPEAEHRGVETAAQQVEDVLDAGLAIRREPPEVRAADHDRPRAEGERLRDIAAAPDAAIEQHLDLVADRRRRCPAASGSAAGVESRLLPPWLETEIAVTPASTARLASSMRVTPFSMNGPPHCSRSQATSSHVGGGVYIHSPYAPKNVGGGRRRRREVRRGEVGHPPGRGKSSSHAGRGTACGRTAWRPAA